MRCNKLRSRTVRKHSKSFSRKLYANRFYAGWISIVILLIIPLLVWLKWHYVDTNRMFAYLNKEYCRIVDAELTKSPNKTDTIPMVILIPIRNREEHLSELVPYLESYFETYDTHIDLREIIAIEQSDDNLFNRGKLFNVGFQSLKERHPTVDWFCTHDVDIKPIHPNTYYPIFVDNHYQSKSDRDSKKLVFPNMPPLHIMPTADYPHYAGGVLCLNKLHFEGCINGYSNQYWGWGGEDDDIYERMRVCQLVNQCDLNEPFRRNHSLKWTHLAGKHHNRDSNSQLDARGDASYENNNELAMAMKFKLGPTEKLQRIQNDGLTTLSNYRTEISDKIKYISLLYRLNVYFDKVD